MSRIYAIDTNTIRFKMGREQVWNAALRVLIHNYNLNIVNKESGIITTEWDSFYLGEKIYRNKISLHLVAVGWGAVDLIIHNNIEILFTPFHSKSTGGLAWIPTRDITKEVSRVVHNMAISLNQPIPVLPSEMVKGASKGKWEQSQQ